MTSFLSTTNRIPVQYLTHIYIYIYICFLSTNYNRIIWETEVFSAPGVPVSLYVVKTAPGVPDPLAVGTPYIKAGHLIEGI